MTDPTIGSNKRPAAMAEALAADPGSSRVTFSGEGNLSAFGYSTSTGEPWVQGPEVPSEKERSECLSVPRSCKALQLVGTQRRESLAVAQQTPPTNSDRIRGFLAQTFRAGGELSE
jgi:hypothetical protein